MLHNVIVVIAVIGIVGYVIGRQLLGEPQRGKRLILLPAILTVIGAVDLGKNGHHPHPVDIVFIVASAIVAAGIGLGQGAMMRLENRHGGLWGQMPAKSLWLWAALVVSRVLIGVIANASGAHVAASTAPILFTLGINRLAQAAMIAPRAFKAGIPFAAEKDGSTFLGSMGGFGPHTDRRAPEPDRPVQGEPTTPSAPGSTRQSTGQQIVGALGDALQERRGQRRTRDRDDRRGSRDRRRR